MHPLPDIRTPEDICRLVDSFYARVTRDELLGPVFNDVAQVDWSAHLPVMHRFWESMLLGAGTYQGAPFPKHMVLPVQREHFSRWLSLFVETVDGHFSGAKAEEAKGRAASIADTFAQRMGLLKDSQGLGVNFSGRARGSLAMAFLLATALQLVPRAVSNISASGTTTPGGVAKEAAPSLAEDAAVLENGRLHARQRALARLALQPGPEADKILLKQFDRFQAKELPGALWLDLFEAAAKRDNRELKARLAERERELAESPDLLSRYRECLEGGDADAGRIVFTQKPEAGCIRCHSVDGHGGAIGPDLTWLRNATDRALILESIINPNAVIAPGFQSAAVTLKNGETVAGVISVETRDEITFTIVADGTKRKVKSEEIVERVPLGSPMPPNFGAVLSKRELRDLVEFIARGD